MNHLIAHLTLAAAFAAGSASADTTLRIDASAPAKAPLENQLKMGSARAPNGDTIGANSQYLTRNGKPWMPVMGEFHYSRSPADEWETELRKMKAAGVDIVATYVMWNHHEATEGSFDWMGKRDLRRFVQLAAKAGLDVVVRVGPWVHAEVKYGGLPGWVVDAMPTRGNDAQYLHYVGRLYDQIGSQLKGLLWKDGGRVIGVQIENEYNLNGAGEGAAHIHALKALAVKAGLDVPLYTVTGWDQTVYPPGEVTPVFGGYPDEPWATSTTELAPKETYAFRFDSRVSGDLGAQTRATTKGTAETDADSTPFLGAEYGAGLPFMYRRRTVVSPSDIASMLPVQLGSGVNLVGYYMFHGGRNPAGSATQQESTASGGYNDTTRISYDFQAPLGPDGQARPVLGALRPFHLFMHDFGDRLAPMTVRKPELTPAGPLDLKTPRWSLRSKGDSAFVFMNNHVRQYPMPAQQGIRFAVTLPHETLVFPQNPVDVKDGAYFIWPVNFDMDGIRLRYASAQPLARLDDGKGGIVYVFAASDGIPAELAFDAKDAPRLGSARAHIGSAAGMAVVDAITPGLDAALTISRPGKAPLTVIVLTAAQARQASIGQLAGQRRMVISGQQSWFDDSGLRLQAAGDPAFKFAVYPAPATALKAAPALTATREGMFTSYVTTLPARTVAALVTPLRAAREAAPVRIGGAAKSALEPLPESFAAAAAWRIDVPRTKAGIDDLIEFDFIGDVGRLFAGTDMLDDWYYSGYRWQVSMRVAGDAAKPLSLSVLPLRADAPIYLPRDARPDFAGKSQLAELRGVRIVPVYKLAVGR